MARGRRNASKSAKRTETEFERRVEEILTPCDTRIDFWTDLKNVSGQPSHSLNCYSAGFEINSGRLYMQLSRWDVRKIFLSDEGYAAIRIVSTSDGIEEARERRQEEMQLQLRKSAESQVRAEMAKEAGELESEQKPETTEPPGSYLDELDEYGQFEGESGEVLEEGSMTPGSAID